MENHGHSREEKIEKFNLLVSRQPGADRKGDTMPYTSLNGNMYSYFTKDNFLALRLPAAERIKFIDTYKSNLVTQYGIVQKEYVEVPEDLLYRLDELQDWFRISHEYAGTLKPKPTTKPKKK